MVQSSSSAQSTSNSIGVRIPTNTITLKETFKCRASDLYRALTVKEVGSVKFSGAITSVSVVRLSMNDGTVHVGVTGLNVYSSVDVWETESVVVLTVVLSEVLKSFHRYLCLIFCFFVLKTGGKEICFRSSNDGLLLFLLPMGCFEVHKFVAYTCWCMICSM